MQAVARDDSQLNDLRSKAQERVRLLRTRQTKLDNTALEIILSGARAHYAWTDKPVSDDLLREVFEISKMGPTSMNSCPARYVIVRTPLGKERLAKAVKPANMAKMMGAPVSVIIAYDTDFLARIAAPVSTRGPTRAIFRQTRTRRRNRLSKRDVTGRILHGCSPGGWAGRWANVLGFPMRS